MYNKLFTKILDSSVWMESTPTRIVWITFLAAMDEDGFCPFASVHNVAARARVSIEEAKLAVTALESPDEIAPDQENEGRRIERVPSGWIVLNAKKYREIVTREHAKEVTRNRVARFRARRRDGNAGVTDSNGATRVEVERNDSVTPSEARTDTRTDTNTPEKQQQVPFIESNLFGESQVPVTKPNGKAKKLVPVGDQVDRASWPGNGRPYPPCEDPNDPEPLNPFYNLDRNHEIDPELWQAYEDWLDRQCPFGDGVPLAV
jgi:hypothetical protein